MFERLQTPCCGGYAVVVNSTATRPPAKELVTDAWQVVQLATLQELTRHWATEHDWRKVEAKLNALPQFTTEIDRVAVPFVALIEGAHACHPPA